MNRPWLHVFTLLTLLLPSTWLSSAQALTAVDVPPSFQSKLLGRNMDILFDESNQLTLEQVRSPDLQNRWQRSTEETPNFGYTNGSAWARFKLGNTEAALALLMEIGYTQTDFIDVYLIRKQSIEHLRAGDHVPRNQWPLASRIPIFPLSGDQETEIYLKISGGASKQMPVTLWTPSAYAEEHISREVFQALYYGALLAMVIYNLLIGLNTGLSEYFTYVGFLLGFGLFQLAMSGHGAHLFWGQSPLISDLSVLAGIVAFGLMSNAFALKLLSLRSRFRIYTFFEYYLILGALGIFLFYFTVGYSSTIKFVALLVVPWFVAMVSYGVVAYKEGRSIAIWYGTAWGCFILASLCVPLKGAGIIPSNAFTNNIQQIGSAIEFILLSFALAERIKVLQTSLQLEQQNALEAEKRAREADLKALEEERRVSEYRDQLVANTSHELRTPLNGMMGLIQAVISRDGGRLSPESKRSLEGVVRSSKRLGALIGDLLDFSRGQRGMIPLYRGAIRLKDQADTVCELLQSTVDQRKISLQQLIGEELPAVDADPDRVQQILFNLLGNAIKFTESGGVTLRAKVNDRRVIVSVEDTGPGIAPEAQSRIFEAFSQADGGIARRYGGTGLGLSIVRNLVEAHGGELGLHSVPGFGSTFWFSLPISTATSQIANATRSPLVVERLVSLETQLATASSDESKAPQDTIPSTLSEAPTGVKRPLHILIVDDEPINRQVLVELLEMSGHQLQTAANGQEALNKIAHSDLPDLILLDVMMPGMSGFEVLKTLRRQYNEAELPIILLTAKAMEKDLVEGFASGASDYILKPFVTTEVEARIQHQARLRRAIWESHIARAESVRLRNTLSTTEEQLIHAERLASIGVSTAGIAHDLNNPLHHVQTTLGWIRNHAQTIDNLPDLPPQVFEETKGIHEAVDLAEKATKTSIDLAQAIRVATRTDEGSSDLLQIREIIGDVLTLLHHKLKHLDVKCSIEQDLAVIGRRSEFIQLVMNLVSNAADAVSSCSRRQLHIQARRVDGRIVLFVDDSGPGIPETMRSVIFEPFYTTKPSGKGTGLGLAVVQTILKHQGGELEVETSPELGGARFKVFLPAA